MASTVYTALLKTSSCPQTRGRRAFDLSAIAAAPKVNIDASNEVWWTYARATAMPIHIPVYCQRHFCSGLSPSSCHPDTRFHYYDPLDPLFCFLTLLHHHDHHLVQIIYHLPSPRCSLLLPAYRKHLSSPDIQNQIMIIKTVYILSGSSREIRRKCFLGLQRNVQRYAVT
jgi:hypothetical protein